MAAFMHCILLILPFAVLAQMGGTNNGVGGTGVGGTGVGGTDLGAPGGQGGNMGPNTGLGGTGGTGVNGGTGGVGVNGGNGGLGGVGASPLPMSTFSSNNQGAFDPGSNGGQLGGTGGSAADSVQVVDDSEELGSGSDEDTTSTNGNAWYGDGAGLGLLKSSGTRWTVTVLSCLLAIAVIALIAFFIIKRKRNSSAAPSNP